jgi:hypothetical protein
MLVLLAVLATCAFPQGTDTTVSLRGGSRLELSSMEGDITVQAWNRSAIRVEADHDDDTRIEIDQGGRTIAVKARARHGPAEVSWRLTVPTEMALDLSSQSGDVRVSGTRGEVSVSTVEGNISVQGGSGYVALESVEGDIELFSTTGRISASTVDGEITIRAASGDLRASAVDGNVNLEDIDSSSLEANTVDGNISFSGQIRAGGRYRMSSHDGDVSVTATSINAEVSVSTFSGEFESDYPVTLAGTQGHGRMSFTLGTGGARLELESFDGTVALRKGSSRKP